VKKQSGFTLVEIICVLLILGILGSFASLGLSQMIKLYLAVKDTDAVIQQAQIAMNRLFLEVVAIDKSVGGTYVMDDPGASTPKTTYQFPSFDGSTPFDNVVSYASDTKILSLNGAPLAENVTAFSMCQNKPGIDVSTLEYVTVSMTVTIGAKSQTLTSQYTLK
jgi:prepilin-type N-terminal cleavage/methylation domain-containing protein